MDDFYKNMRETEDKCLMRVLSEYLNRTPNFDDFKNCIIGHEQDDEGNIDYNWYWFKHKDTLLGKVEKHFVDLKYTFTFTPIHIF